MRPRPCSPGGYERRSTPHLWASAALQERFWPSRRPACTGGRCRGPSGARLRLRGRQPLWACGVVLDRGHVEAGCLQRADRGAGPSRRPWRPRPSPGRAPCPSWRLRRRSGPRTACSCAALEAGAARRLPGDHGALGVGRGHDRVVEGSLDVGLAVGDVLLGPAAALLRLWHLAVPPAHLAVGAFCGPRCSSGAGLAGARVGLGALPTNRQSAPVPEPAVGGLLQALDVLRRSRRGPPSTSSASTRLAQLHHLFLGQVLDLGVRVVLPALVTISFAVERPIP